MVAVGHLHVLQQGLGVAVSQQHGPQLAAGQTDPTGTIRGHCVIPDMRVWMQGLEAEQHGQGRGPACALRPGVAREDSSMIAAMGHVRVGAYEASTAQA